MADYAADLVPHLAARAELELFHEGRTPPPPELAERWPCRPSRPIQDLSRALDTEPFDGAVEGLRENRRVLGPHRVGERRIGVDPAHPGLAQTIARLGGRLRGLIHTQFEV